MNEQGNNSNRLTVIIFLIAVLLILLAVMVYALIDSGMIDKLL